MKREADLRRRLRSLHTLGEAVGAMKNLAAHHFRQARGAVEPARIYREGVERLLARSGGALPAGPGPAGLLVIGGELGLCGAHNARIAAAAARRREELAPGPTIAVGHRTAALLARRGIDLRATYAAPTSVAGIPDLLLPLAEVVLTTYVGERLSRFDVVSSLFAGVGAERPATSRILPVEAAPAAAAPPTRYVPAARVATAAVREMLYIVMYDLLLGGLASEHSAHLVATQSAESWLDDRTVELRRHLAASRRESSTQEMLEIAAGARAPRAGGSLSWR